MHEVEFGKIRWYIEDMIISNRFPENWFIVYPETLQQSADMHGNIAENRVEQFTTDS